ncbi:MAG: DUF3322 domain-containing protein [Verrucomicrobiota bacterium JB024]|nr:DUF3322 domain-containing protein [Verrucomicrobiota bacterium JB024]
MKSPSELAAKLARQWDNADLREQRLTQPQAWPLSLSIGKPGAAVIRNDLNRVRTHLQAWQACPIGEVEWHTVSYRDAADSIVVPLKWQLRSPSEWIAASGQASITNEYETLNELCQKTNPRYHRLWMRQRSWWRGKPIDEILLASSLADQLGPGCAAGAPLRTLSGIGNDTKFFERNRALLLALLDLRFEGEAGKLGLEGFLGAMPEGEHWLLVADLDGALLPFELLRVRASELEGGAILPGQQFLVVENERCLFMLPKLPGVLAILGSGLNLRWLSAPAFTDREIAYWGDMDTWGLTMLSMAKSYRPNLRPLLMNRELFDKYAEGRAVQEKSQARLPMEHTLTKEETDLFNHLACREYGRLEQEFLPAGIVEATLNEWHERHHPG